MKRKYIEGSDMDAAKALANEIGVDVKDLQDLSGKFDHYEPDYTFGVNGGSDAIYLVYDNEESARMAAIDDLSELFRDDPSILAAAIDYFGFDFFIDYLNGVDEEDLADLESLSEDMHKEEFAQYIQNNIGVDYMGFAEANIDRLDPEWHLATYDGKEIELANGMVAYRVE